jgi:uncharacterized membrane protein YcaP (DUF421 family)
METMAHVANALIGFSAKAEQFTIVQGIIRALLVYIVLIVVVRFGKKRFLGEATAFDVILVIIIGSTASRAIVGNAPLFVALAAVIALVAFHWVISLVARDSRFFSILVKGHSTLIIKDGKVQRKNMRAAHMSADDLDEDLRHNGVSEPAQVAEARLERDGKLSVLRK